ncbi:winged helix DNA-binding protein [Pseudoxanthobacter sp.]|uniref:MarR family winged helix-turn-helix transcriptional regulator n=1 Tax=Pseudoxanthobacter sp. TaxID=1925742 RepID=UPI002FE2DB55
MYPTHAIETRNASAEGGADGALKPSFLEAVMLVERVHRRFLDVVKDELDRLRRADVNSVQAVLLYNIGDSELSAGELKSRGYYLGSNVSYNIKKLTEAGFLVQERSLQDRRSIRIRLTTAGRQVAAIVANLYERNARTLGEVGVLDATDLKQMTTALQRLDRFWDDQIRYRM